MAFGLGKPSPGQKQKKKNTNSQQNLVVFLAGTHSENKIIYLLYRTGQKNIWTKLSSLEQEPTFLKKGLSQFLKYSSWPYVNIAYTDGGILCKRDVG